MFPVTTLSRLALVLGLALPTVAAAEPGMEFVKSADPQYVLISFDNSNGITEWERSRALAAKTGARFTYFLSCVFLIPKSERKSYEPPRHPAGASNVGFAPSRDDVALRLSQIWKARSEGHEIGSHACGHFDGKDWSREDWVAEFDAFKAVLSTAFSANGIGGEPKGWREFARSDIKGFRAPYLSSNKAMLTALVEQGFAYDASGVSRMPEQPTVGDGLAKFALPQIPEGPNERRVLAMDYNLFVRHSGGFERTDEGAVFEQRAYEAFHKALAREMAGARAPLQLGFHFTMMNGGAYWRALERFATEVCGRPDVACVTYGDYLRRTAPKAAVAAGNLGG